MCPVPPLLNPKAVMAHTRVWSPRARLGNSKAEDGIAEAGRRGPVANSLWTVEVLCLFRIGCSARARACGPDK